MSWVRDEYSEVIPRFEKFSTRNNDCTECPFYEEECDGSSDRCLMDAVSELLQRGSNLEKIIDDTSEANAKPLQHGEAKIELTKNQGESLLEFIELNLFDAIRNDTDIDNLDWLQNMMDVRSEIKRVVEKKNDGD